MRGLDNGRTILRNSFQLLHPSILLASCNSTGIVVEKNVRETIMLYAEVAPPPIIIISLVFNNFQVLNIDIAWN